MDSRFRLWSFFRHQSVLSFPFLLLLFLPHVLLFALPNVVSSLFSVIFTHLVTLPDFGHHLVTIRVILVVTFFFFLCGSRDDTILHRFLR